MDTIIHAGARTDHFGDDDELKKVNVRGTVNIILGTTTSCKVNICVYDKCGNLF